MQASPEDNQGAEGTIGTGLTPEEVDTNKCKGQC